MRVELQRAKVTQFMWSTPNVALLEIESDLIEFGTRYERGECSQRQAMSRLRVLGERMNDLIGARGWHPRLTRRMSHLPPEWSWSLDWPLLAVSAVACFATSFAIIACAT